MSTKNNNTTNNNPSRKTHTFKQRIHGFTLVELIVVITILIILGTVAFISIGGYSSNARDSSRISDINNISKGLAISYQKTGYYPDPDNIFNITYSGGVLWTQGTVGSGTMNVINAGGGGFNLSKKPTDPLITTKEYTYSKLAYGNGYQLKADWEGDSVSFFINQAYATNGNPTLAYVKGNFGGLTARTFTGGVNYILAIPSIVTNTGISGTPLEINNNVLSGTLLFNGKTLSGASAFNPKIVVFSGTSLPKDDSTQQITNMMSALKAAYIGTDIATQTTISTLVNTATGQLASLGSSVLSNQMGVSGVGTSGGGGNPCGTGSQLGYTIAPLSSGQSQTFTKAITNGTGGLLATCNNGSLTYGTETAISCTIGLPIGNACTCPTGATCETNGMKYLTPGTYTFSISGSLTVSAVAVGGGGGGGYQWSSGGGGGGGLGWKNNIALLPNTTYTVVVGVGGTSMPNANQSGSEGGNSYFVNMSTVVGYGGGRGGNGSTSASNGYGGGYLGDGGGRGGNGGYDGSWNYAGAGAGGYTGQGADTYAGSNNGDAAPAGGGGGGGGWYSSTYGTPAGGGVGIYGQGASGAANGQYCGGKGGSPSNGTGTNGVGGEGCSSPGSQAITGGFPGGGGGGSGTSWGGGKGGGGAVRIIWGAGRSFPNSAS